MRNRLKALLCASLITGCSAGTERLHGMAQAIDLDRFMGSWYVLAFIPIDIPLLPMFSEADAHNGVESYMLQSDGTIKMTYTFRRGGFDGTMQRLTPTATVANAPVNSEWRMKFAWYLPAGDFLILHVDEDYTTTLIGVPDRRYLWIMARTPDLPAARFESLLTLAKHMGYDVSRVRRVPQRWP